MRRGFIVCAWASALAGSALALAPPVGRPDASVEVLIERLGSAQYAERENATARLACRDDALPALRQAALSADLEVRRRARLALQAFQVRRFRADSARAESLLRSGDWDQAVELLVRSGEVDTKGENLGQIFRLLERLVRAEAQQATRATLPPERAMLARRERFDTFRDLQQYQRLCAPGPHSSSSRWAAESSLGFVRAPAIDIKMDAYCSVLVTSGEVSVGHYITDSIVLAHGPVEAWRVNWSLIICDEGVTAKFDVDNSIVIARGAVKCGQATSSLLTSAEDVTVTTGDPAWDRNVIRQHQSSFLGGLRFFDLSRVGLVVEEARGGPVVRAVGPGEALFPTRLRPGDVITAVGTERVASVARLRSLMREAAADGNWPPLTVKRRSGTLTIRLAG